MTSPARRRVGISLGLIGSLSDGLGEFSTQICERIAAAAPAWREQGVEFHLHMHERWHGRFGHDVGYLAAHKRQGYWHWPHGGRFDLWHSLNQLGRVIPPWGTRHALLTIHDLNPIYHDAPAEAQKALKKLRQRLRHFDEVSTLTQHVQGDIRQHLRWQGPITVIPNGARDLTGHPMEPIPGLPEGRFLLHLSRMAASKNPQSLVDMAAVWPEQTIVLAGPRTADSERIRLQAEQRGLQNLRVVQEVNDAQKAWLYANCCGFLFPSLTEGFGLPPLEAMHFGKPVFLSRLTSLPEVGGDAADYFDSFDPNAMRSTIETALPRRLADPAALRRHAARFSWDAAFQRYLSLYARMLGLPVPPGH